MALVVNQTLWAPKFSDPDLLDELYHKHTFCMEYRVDRCNTGFTRGSSYQLLHLYN
jgi:hypothetical protein